MAKARAKSKSKGAGKPDAGDKRPSSKPSKGAKGASGEPGLLRPVSGILLGGAALLVLAGLVSYRPHAAGGNWAGPVGHGLSATLLEALGVGAYAMAGFLLLCSAALVAQRPRLSIFKTIAWGTVAFGVMSLAALLLREQLQGHLPGGVVGALLAGSLRSSLSTVGAALLLFSATAAALVVATDLWALRAAAVAGRMSLAGGALAMRGAVGAVNLARERAAARAAQEAENAANDDEEASDGESDEGDSDGDESDGQSRAAAPGAPEVDGRKKKLSAKESAEIAEKAAILQRAATAEAPQDPRLHAPTIVEPILAAGGKKKKPAANANGADAAGLALAAVAGAAAADGAKSAATAAAATGAAKSDDSKKNSSKSPLVKEAAAATTAPDAAADLLGAEASAPTIIEPRPPPKPAPAAAISITTADLPMRPKPVPGAPKVEAKEEKREFTLFGGRSAFTAPPIDILTGEAQGPIQIDREKLTATAEKLRATLASHGIQGQVTQIRPGPVVTMFEFLPAAGVKVSRISSLSDDLAMGMKALRVRIIAPIPGKGVVGIEIPNENRQTVVLKELVEQEAFQKSPSKLAMCLGKDVEGMPYIVDLAKMPHALIAGTTGSGKSVAVNSMIVSMLLRATPEEVRFLMIDPKMLELSVYEGIPHLLLPVVTDSKKAAMALRWAVEEMERRYQLLAECGVRNITSYNKKVEKEGDDARKAVKPPKEKRVIDLTDPQLDLHDLQAAIANGEVEAQDPSIGLKPTTASASARAAFLADGPGAIHGGRESRGALANGAGAMAQTTAEWLRNEMEAQGTGGGRDIGAPIVAEPLRKLPYLVIIIDELADLMMVASREVETYIARLAQMARAAGIHLMVATQRPSTDVVTGVIKANFPTRISFQVASRHDSATIINTPGAENLLGMGDMLIVPPGTSSLTRVHGPYVDEKEIHAVVEHWKAQGAPVYDPNILKPRAEDGEGADGAMDDEAPDELYDQALAALGDMRFISISLLQRKLRVGYNRAARMIERMERDGVVGPADGAKPREVLIRPVGEMPGIGA